MCPSCVCSVCAGVCPCLFCVHCALYSVQSLTLPDGLADDNSDSLRSQSTVIVAVGAPAQKKGDFCGDGTKSTAHKREPLQWHTQTIKGLTQLL